VLSIGNCLSGTSKNALVIREAAFLYTMQAKLAYLGESVERWEVKAGEKLMYFENNRPALEAIKSNKVVKWKMVKGVEYIKDPAQAALMLGDLWALIERKSSGKRLPTFQEARTCYSLLLFRFMKHPKHTHKH
jgi:hypothetical protein